MSNEIRVLHPTDEDKARLLQMATLPPRTPESEARRKERHENSYDRWRLKVASVKYQRLMSKLSDRKPCPACGILCQVCDQNKRCCLK